MMNSDAANFDPSVMAPLMSGQHPSSRDPRHYSHHQHQQQQHHQQQGSYIPNPYDSTPTPFYGMAAPPQPQPQPQILHHHPQQQQQVMPQQPLYGAGVENPYSIYDPGLSAAATATATAANIGYPAEPMPMPMPVAVNETMYYDPPPLPPRHHHHIHLDPKQDNVVAAAYGGDWNGAMAPAEINMTTPQHHDPLLVRAATTTEPGYYYPHAEATPLLPPWGTAPVTALAYDDVYAAMYVASATQSNARSPDSHFGVGASSSLRSVVKVQPHHTNYDRSAMLAVHCISSVDASAVAAAGVMEHGMLYSSVAAHPEASRNTLMDIYSHLYGFSPGGSNNNKNNNSNSSGSNSSTSSPGRVGKHHHHHHIPSHAYKPVYGRTNSSTPGMDLASAMVGGAFSLGKNTFHMGISTLLPLSGCVASVSPSAVRVHAHGGLQLADHALEGMLCGTVHPDGAGSNNHRNNNVPSHITVGGILPNLYTNNNNNSNGNDISETARHSQQQQQKEHHHLYCLDIWGGLQIVSSRKIHDKDNNSTNTPLGVTALATSHARGSIVAGCSDGKVRFLDGSLREVAKIRGHASSVNNIAVSEDGTLIATTGYGYRPSGSTSLYAFPDPNILLFDIRYLGRGGIAHPFSGLSGGPRFLSFIPSLSDSQHSNRLLVASGQSGGGMQIIVPFEPSQNDIPANFMLPQLDRGESISAMVVSEDNLALGTSQCRVLQYKMAGYPLSTQQRPLGSATSGGSGKEFIPSANLSPARSPSSVKSMAEPTPRPKQPLEIPPYILPQPPLSLDPSLLQSDNPNVRNGINDRIKSIFTAYTLVGEPTLSHITPAPNSSFGPLSENVLLTSSRRKIAPQLTSLAESSEGDFLMTIPTASLELDLLLDHSNNSNNNHSTKANQKPNHLNAKEQEPLPNPNKSIYAKKVAALCYQQGHHQTGKLGDERTRKGSGSQLFQDDSNHSEIPTRYRLTLRPSFKSGSSFDHAEFNRTGLFPGWDYPPTMPNAFASPVLLLFYFNPELRSKIFKTQYHECLLSPTTPYDTSMIPELGSLFHQLENLSRIAYSYPTNLPYQGPRVRAWVPSNFLASLVSMPEAEQLQILDGSPAAVDLPRRPEAFYLFLLYQVDKELSKISEPKLLDSMHGTDFMSVNEFITGSGETSQSTARALTIELAYDNFREETSCVRFGKILQRALCRETRLRAWNQNSRSYETIVQRKIATSLPGMLSLSCACAGRKEEDGLNRWRSTLSAEDHWLPEIIEVELEDDGGVVVRECVHIKEDKWETFRASSKIPSTVSKLVLEQRASTEIRKYRYRLDAVVSYVRDDMDPSVADMNGEVCGHHVVHVRVPKAYKEYLLSEQHREVQSLAETDWSKSKMVVTENNWDADRFQPRADRVQALLDALKSDDSADNSWILANGYVVSDTVIEDARAFHVAFKEPCLVIYRAIDPASTFGEGEGDEESESGLKPSNDLSDPIPPDVMSTRSITDGRLAKYAVDLESLPGEGDLIAFDAEFVSVQEEESTLTKSGSKVTLREVRHAVARISVIDCKTRQVIIDNHVLPQEPVVDYLTRFSGIVARDLDPVQSPHHLISTRSAYLKLRFLMERGCIFVGHGLCQDFLMVNLVVPNQQIIDTVEIFHQDRMRYISLRFLANYILGRDMQRDTHDSVEDALAAYEIYLKALELKENGTFGKVLIDLYDFGRKTDWKLGVDATEK